MTRHIKKYKDIPIYSDSTYAVGCVNGDYKKIKKNVKHKENIYICLYCGKGGNTFDYCFKRKK